MDLICGAHEPTDLIQVAVMDLPPTLLTVDYVWDWQKAVLVLNPHHTAGCTVTMVNLDQWNLLEGSLCVIEASGRPVQVSKGVGFFLMVHTWTPWRKCATTARQLRLLLCSPSGAGVPRAARSDGSRAGDDTVLEVRVLNFLRYLFPAATDQSHT